MGAIFLCLGDDILSLFDDLFECFVYLFYFFEHFFLNISEREDGETTHCLYSSFENPRNSGNDFELLLLCQASTKSSMSSSSTSPLQNF